METSRGQEAARFVVQKDANSRSRTRTSTTMNRINQETDRMDSLTSNTEWTSEDNPRQLADAFEQDCLDEIAQQEARLEQLMEQDLAYVVGIDCLDAIA
jgi:hypothetical protein